MKVLIIEDEIPARKKLKRFLEELEEPITIVGEIRTIQEAIAFLEPKPELDLILSDIELQDGNAFEIYTKVKITCPIIFTTAYNQFLMDAFESNGIEYLLKPFSLERFKKAWNKFIGLRQSNSSENDLVTKLNQIINQPSEVKTTKKRFTINTSKEMYFLETEAILFFTAEEGVVFAIDKQAKKHLLTQTTLKEIEEVLDTSEFFRINRSDLVNKKHIVKIEKYSKNSLAIKLSGYEKHLITSQSNTKAFRDWIEE